MEHYNIVPEDNEPVVYREADMKQVLPSEKFELYRHFILSDQLTIAYLVLGGVAFDLAVSFLSDFPLL